MRLELWMAFGVGACGMASGCHDRPLPNSEATAHTAAPMIPVPANTLPARPTTTDFETTMPPEDSCLIYFDNDAFGLDEAAAALRKTSLAVTRGEDSLRASYADGPVLTIQLKRGPAVRKDAATLGRGTPHATRLGRCGSRLVISFADLDAVLDEINTLIEVQASLEAATGGITYNTWNGQISDVE